MKERDDLDKDNKKRKGKKYINLISKFPLETEVDGWNTVDAQPCGYGELEKLDQWPSLGLMGGREKQRGEL